VWRATGVVTGQSEEGMTGAEDRRLFGVVVVVGGVWEEEGERA